MLVVEHLGFHYGNNRQDISSFSCTLRALPQGGNPRKIYCESIEPILRKTCGLGALRIKASEAWCSLWCERKFHFPASAVHLLWMLLSRNNVAGIDVTLREEFEDPAQSRLIISFTGLRLEQQRLVQHALASIQGLQFAPEAQRNYASFERFLSGQ